MSININFFRSNDAGKLDYEALLTFFDEIDKFKTYMSEDEVEIVFEDSDFNFSYRYLITKKSRVNQIYKLSPKYTNVNFLLEMPVLIPTFIAREILELCQKVCKNFELEVYHDSFDDIKPFNTVTLLSLFKDYRDAYIEEYGLQGKLPFDADKLELVCKYQRRIENWKEYFHNDIEVDPCTVLIDKNSNTYGICSLFKFDKPTLFPANIDYISITTEENIEFKVRQEDFFAIMDKYLELVGEDSPGMKILKPKKVRKAHKTLAKLRKMAIQDQAFDSLRICDLIDK